MSASATTTALAWVLTLAAAVTAGAAPAARGRGVRHFEDITGDLPNEPVTAVAVDPTDPQVLYAGLDGFVFLTDDGGDTWRPVLSFPRGILLDDTSADLADDADAEDDLVEAPDSEDGSVIDENGEDLDVDELPDGALDDVAGATLADGSESGAFDDGEELPEGDVAVSDELDATVFARTGAGVRSIAFVTRSPGVAYVATPRGLYRTIAMGGMFERLSIPGGATENDVRDVAVDPLRPSRLYVATAAGLLVSRDGGASFQAAPGTAGSTPALCVTAVAAAADVSRVEILVGTERGLFRSTDSGDTYLEVLLRGLPPFFAVPAVAITEQDSTYYAGTSQGLYVGERGATLLERHAGVGGVLVQAILPDPSRPRGVVLGTRDRGVLFSLDAGLTVDERAEQVPAAEVLALSRPASPVAAIDEVVVATDRGLFRSVPGTGITMSASAIRALRERWSKELSLEETARQALAYSGLPSGVQQTATRAGLAKLLPVLDARYQIVVGQTIENEFFLLRAGDNLPPGIDPDADNTDLFGNVGAFLLQPAQGVRQSLVVRLIWDLDRLIMNTNEQSLIRSGGAWYAAERSVIERVQELWSVRRRLMTEDGMWGIQGSDAAAVRAQLRRALRVEELTAQLDGATGGAFSNSKVEDSR